MCIHRYIKCLHTYKYIIYVNNMHIYIYNILLSGYSGGSEKKSLIFSVSHSVYSNNNNTETIFMC